MKSNNKNKFFTIRVKVTDNPNQVIEKGAIEYLINDVSTPYLVKSLILPDNDIKPSIYIKGYSGGNYPKFSKQWRISNAFVTVKNVMDVFNNIQEVPRWPGTRSLMVDAHAGVALNAFYNRKALKFFYVHHEQYGSFYTSESSDIVAHELGHAILDAYRPDMWSVMSLEVASFHEAFADFTAFLHVASYDEVIADIICHTKGNLRNQHPAINIGESLGHLMAKAYKDKYYSNGIRSGVNDFKYAPPETLPKEASPDQLAAECHSFGRIYFGALYDIFVFMHETYVKEGFSIFDSIRKASDTIKKYLIKATLNAPLNARFFESISKTLLWVDVVDNNRKFHDGIYEIFKNRNILSEELRVLNIPKYKGKLIDKIQCHQACVRLQDVSLQICGNHSNDQTEIFVASGGANLFDKNQECIYQINENVDDSMMAAQHMLNYIDLDDQNSMFGVDRGKIQRKFII